MSGLNQYQIFLKKEDSHSNKWESYESDKPVKQYILYISLTTPAFADTEMKRQAIQRADVLRQGVEPPPAIWENDEEMILKLSGLV